MHGQLFTFLDIPFPSYFVLLLSGFVLATVLGAVWAKRIGQDPDVMVDLGLAMLLSGVAGARILHVLVDGYFWDYVHLCTDPSQVSWPLSKAECLRVMPNEWLDQVLGCTGQPGPRGRWDHVANVCRPAERDCLAWAKFYAGGLTYYGGFLASSATAWWLLKVDRFPFWKAADAAGMIVALGLGFGRMGCLLAGCCFGVTSESSWALVFPPGSPASEWQAKAGLLERAYEPSLPVHPTQIYESAASFAIAAFLMLFLHERKRYDGHVFLAFVGLYAAARAVLEFLRSDDRGGLGLLSTSQLIGIGLIVAAVWLHRKLLARLGDSTGDGATA
jgi:phosphatidylglycerol:prolipoprotein diacylglycerol transferase